MAPQHFVDVLAVVSVVGGQEEQAEALSSLGRPGADVERGSGPASWT